MNRKILNKAKRKNIYMDEKTNKKLVRLCKDTRMSESAFIRNLIHVSYGVRFNQS